jgi:hypothetical protein
VKLLEREQGVAAGRPRLNLQHRAHARQHRCVQAVGFRQAADRLGEAARLPALVATRFNPDLKAKYNQLSNAGRPAKVALTAVMRKLILLANALLKANRTWPPKTRLIKTDTLELPV